MTPNDFSNAHNITEIQDGRIRRLEDFAQELSEKVTSNGVKIENFIQQIEDMNNHLSEKIDSVVDRLSDKLQTVDQFSNTLNKHTEKIEHLSSQEHVRQKRMAMFKKVFMAALVAASGALGHRFMTIFWK